MTDATPAALPPEALRWRCDPAQFPFETTADVEPAEGIVGQEVAVDALRFGLETSAPGQHVFVRGITGTGRTTLVRRLLETIKPDCREAPDRAYVFNFKQPDRPRLLTLERGGGDAFRRRIERFITFVREELGEGLSSDVVKSRTGDIEKQATEAMEAVAKPFEDELREAGLMLMRIQAGPVQRQVIVPVIDGEPAPPERVEALRREGKLSDEDHAAMIEKLKAFTERLQGLGEQMQEIQGDRIDKLGAIITDEARALVESALKALRRDFPGEDVQEFLDGVVDDLVTRRLGELGEGNGAFAERYRVNVVSSHEGGAGCPTIVEHAPSVQALIGTIDRSLDPDDNVPAPQMMIRGGSLLRADGGFLVLEGLDLLMEPGAWKTLIRTLRSGSLEMVPPALPVPWQVIALKPDPIPIKVKIVLLGDAQLYYALDAADSDFRDHFKVLADFETTMPRTGESLHHYASVLARIQREEELRPFDRGAVAALCEHGARIASQEERLTARFGRLADLAREAAFLAEKEDATHTLAEHVTRAVRRTKARADLPARRFREMIAKGVIRVHTQGRAIGQINGLAVMTAGPLTYGFPNRITATIGPGTAGTINIDREAELSGAIHTKGFYILGGLLRYLLRTEHPLAFNASVAFEQSYGGIDGDSASGAEICCLLSALTDLPLDQGLAMTGAIDQVGNILPIGGVNEKIEGFFDACRDSGPLTGSQGVIIPLTNAGDLMLRQDVVDACAEGRFRVHAVDTIHEALELFTGRPAGALGDDGTYPEDTVLGIAVQRAHDYWTMAIRSGDADA